MIRDSLKTYQCIQEYDSGFRAALISCQTLHMCRTQCDLQLICLTLFFNDLHRLFFATLFQCLDRIPEAVDTDVFHLLDLFSEKDAF